MHNGQNNSALITDPSRHSISLQALATEVTTCAQATRELYALSQDLHRLLTSEGPNIARIPEILTRRLSALFPFGSGESALDKIQAVIRQLMSFGVNPALVLHGAQKAMGAGVGKIDSGRQVLVKAIHGAGGQASTALDLYHTCAGLYSLYNTYTELSRLYASMQFCSQRVCTSAQELAALTGSDEQWKMINEAFSEYWNQPGFDFQAFIQQNAEQFKVMLAPIQGLIVLYETMEPVRMATYLAMTMRAEPNAESQLDQVTYLLTNACYNTALENLNVISKNAGDLLSKTLSGVAINAGITAALTACATAVTGMSFPITIAILATCITDSGKRDALIAYVKSRVMGSQIGETKSDTGVFAAVLKQLDGLKNSGSALLSPLSAKITPKINQLLEKCIDANGTVIGDITENAIRTLIQDNGIEPILKEKMDAFIYQVLDETLKQTLQIPEEKVFREQIQNMSNEGAAVYQACGALIPDMVKLLAVPQLVKAQLEATTGNPLICSDARKPLSIKEKGLQAATRAVSAVVKTNVAATLGMIQAGLALKTAIQGAPEAVQPALPSSTVLETVLGYAEQAREHIAGNAAALPLSALGSTANRELTKGLRIHLVEEGTPEATIPAPAIIFARKTTPRLGGLMSSESIEIKSFKISKKTRGLATALTSLIDATRIIHMEALDKEDAELKTQSETVVRENASRTNPISSVLLSLDHPLVRLITERLEHDARRFNYVEQNEMQQTTLVAQRQRAIEHETLRQQAIALAKTKEIAARCGFDEAFFENFQNTPIIQERYSRLLEAIKGVDALRIDLAADEAIKVREYLRRRLTNEVTVLLSHMNAAIERFNALQLNEYSIKTRLPEIKKAIETVDNLGWFGTTWFPPTVAPQARTHYLALLDLQERELKSTLAALEQPLQDLETGNYEGITAYVTENPTKAGLLLAEVSLYQNTFRFWQLYPLPLLKLKELLSDIVTQNKPGEEIPSVRIHLPAPLGVPALRFTDTSKPNTPSSSSPKAESKGEQEKTIQPQTPGPGGKANKDE